MNLIAMFLLVVHLLPPYQQVLQYRLGQSGFRTQVTSAITNSTSKGSGTGSGG
jgi:hypothetical protein